MCIKYLEGYTKNWQEWLFLESRAVYLSDTDGRLSFILEFSKMSNVNGHIN
jgi:hypothetical protein